MGEQPGILRFCARDYPAVDRRAVLQENFCRGVLNIDWSPLGEELDFEIESRWVSDVAITRGYNSAHVATNHDCSRDRDDFLLVWATSGGAVTHLGREVESANSLAFLSSGEKMRVQQTNRVQHGTVRLPRNLLQSLLPNAEDLLCRPISKKSEIFRLLDGYVGLLFSSDRLSDPVAAQLAADHLCELVANVARGQTTSSEIGEIGGVRAARLSAIKHWTVRRLHEPELSVGSAAAAHRLSERYVQMLFKAEHSSFSDFVRAERLALARRRLTNPGLLHQPISVIALDVGFSDISHFNRSFRAAYGQTPSEVREEARIARSR